MKKQEIQTKIEQAKADKQAINENLQRLEKELREAEPKLRHGDFGYWIGCCSEEEEKAPTEYIHLISDGKLRPADKKEYYYKQTTVENNYSIFGNIFDLLKEWNKPFVEWNKSNMAFGIEIVNNRIDVYSCTNVHCTKENHSCCFGIERAEEFWMALGQAIFELKKKQNK